MKPFKVLKKDSSEHQNSNETIVSSCQSYKSWHIYQGVRLFFVHSEISQAGNSGGEVEGEKLTLLSSSILRIM